MDIDNYEYDIYLDLGVELDFNSGAVIEEEKEIKTKRFSVNRQPQKSVFNHSFCPATGAAFPRRTGQRAGFSKHGIFIPADCKIQGTWDGFIFLPCPGEHHAHF